MPDAATQDPSIQDMYDELNRRGFFTSDAESQAIGHELRARGLVRDTTQGGLIKDRTVNAQGISTYLPSEGVGTGRVSTFGGPSDRAEWLKSGGKSGDAGYTSSGNTTFDKPNGLYAALPKATLQQLAKQNNGKIPWGMPITVTHPGTGKSVTVPLWDTGPAAWTKRAIDISPAAMTALGGNTDDTVQFKIGGVSPAARAMRQNIAQAAAEGGMTPEQYVAASKKYGVAAVEKGKLGPARAQAQAEAFAGGGLPDTTGAMLNRSFGFSGEEPTTPSEELQKMKGFMPGVARGALSMADPTNLIVAARLAKIAKTGLTGQRIILAAFGAPAGYGAYQRAVQGDPMGALGELVAFVGPMGVHEIGRRIGMTPKELSAAKPGRKVPSAKQVQVQEPSAGVLREEGPQVELQGVRGGPEPQGVAGAGEVQGQEVPQGVKTGDVLVSPKGHEYKYVGPSGEDHIIEKVTTGAQSTVGQDVLDAMKPKSPAPRIISSDLDRAVHTAEEVAKETGGSVEKNPALQPMHLGEAEGTMTSAKLAPILEDHFKNRPDEPLPGTSKEGVPGESPNEFVGSRLPAIDQIFQEVGNGTVEFGRHGTTELNNANANVEVTRGSTNVPLDTQGKADAARLGQQVGQNPPNAYLSTHYRIRQLAKAAMEKGWVPVDPKNPVEAIDLDTFLKHDKTNEPGTIMRVHVENGRPVRWENLDKSGKVVDSGNVPPVSAPTPTAVGPQRPPTGAKNAIVEPERAARGMNPVQRQAYTLIGDAYHLGKDAVDTGRVDPRKLASDVAGKPRPLNTEEVGALAYDRARLINQHEEALGRATEAISKGDDVAASHAKNEMLQAERDLDFNDQALVKGGREQSAAFQARKMMVKSDYSLAQMINRAKVANRGEISATARKQIEELHTQLKEVNEKIAKHEESLKANEERIKELEAQRTVSRIAKEEALKQRQTRRAETKADLKKERDEIAKSISQKLGRAQSGIPADILPEVGRLARNLIKDGFTTVQELVDEAHKFLSDHIDNLTKREVRDAISGYGKQPGKPQTPEQQKLSELKSVMSRMSKLEDAMKGEKPKKRQVGPVPENVKQLGKDVDSFIKANGLEDPRKPNTAVRLGLTPEAKLKGAKTRLTKQIAEYERKVQMQDTTKTTRPKIELDTEGEALRLQRDKIRNQYRRMVAQMEKPHWTDYLTGWQRFAILSGLTSIGKITTAGAVRAGTIPVEDIFTSGLKQLPGIKQIAAKAPVEGVGFNPRAEAKALTEMFSKATLEDMRLKLKEAAHSLDIKASAKEIGEAAYMHRFFPVLDFFGNLHGALKTPAQRNHYFRVFQNLAEQAARNGKDLKDPVVQSDIVSKAYAESKRAILMGDNEAVSLYRNLLNTLKAQGKHGTAAALTTLMPIVKVPTNYMLEASNYVGGIPLGVMKLIAAKGVKNLTPDQADSVMRAFKKGGIGLGLVAMGYYNAGPVQSGGYYQEGKKKGDLDYGQVSLFGVPLPKWASHTPWLEAIHFGTTMRNAMEPTSVTAPQKSIMEGVTKAVGGLVRETPFMETPSEIMDALKNQKSLEKFAGRYAGGILVPQIVQQPTKYFDRDSSGNPIKRNPQNFLEYIGEGVPVARQQIQSKNEIPGTRRRVRF